MTDQATIPQNGESHPSPSAPAHGGRASEPPKYTDDELRIACEDSFKRGFQAGRSSVPPPMPPAQSPAFSALPSGGPSLASAVSDYPYPFDGHLIAAAEARPLEGALFKGEVFRPTRLELNPHDPNYGPATMAIFVAPNGKRVVGKPHEFFPGAPQKDLAPLGTIRRSERYELMMTNYQGHLQGVIYGEAVGITDTQVPQGTADSAEVGIDIGSQALVAPGASIEIRSEVLPTRFEFLRAHSLAPCLVDAVFGDDGTEVSLDLTRRGADDERNQLTRVSNMPRKQFSSGVAVRVRLKNVGEVPAPLSCVLVGRVIH